MTKMGAKNGPAKRDRTLLLKKSGRKSGQRKKVALIRHVLNGVRPKVRSGMRHGASTLLERKKRNGQTNGW